jgi:hypothetical protein
MNNRLALCEEPFFCFYFRLFLFCFRCSFAHFYSNKKRKEVYPDRTSLDRVMLLFFFGKAKNPMRKTILDGGFSLVIVLLLSSFSCSR